MTNLSLQELLVEYTAACSYSIGLVEVLEPEQVAWRPDSSSSAMGWHLGHQGAVNHFMVRNLTAAEPTLSADFDAVFDSATPESDRGDLPPLDEILDYRSAISASTRRIVNLIDSGEIGAPTQLPLIAKGMLVAIINHEYQHAKWIGEVRSTMTDTPAPTPQTGLVALIDGYYMVTNPDEAIEVLRSSA